MDSARKNLLACACKYVRLVPSGSRRDRPEMQYGEDEPARSVPAAIPHVKGSYCHVDSQNHQVMTSREPPPTDQEKPHG